MSVLMKDEIIQMIEQLGIGQRLTFKLHETFGGGSAVIELNPLHPQKKQKKFILRVGKDVEVAKNAAPFWSSDKAKDLAGWVADRAVEITERPSSIKEAV